MPDFEATVFIPAGTRVSLAHGLGVVPPSTEIAQMPDYDPPVITADYDDTYFYIQSTNMSVSLNVRVVAWRVEQ